VIGTLYVDNSDSCTDFEAEIPECVYMELEIIDSCTVEGLKRSMEDMVFRFPLLEIQESRYTSKKQILDILQSIAVRLGHDPPNFD